jgi:hypothetical protein
MHYAQAMQRTVNPANTLANALGWTCVLLLAALYALAIGHGVVTIDVARDLYWGQQILHEGALPLLGPPVGTTTFLGAFWYYVIAAVLSISGSLTVYFSLMGLLAASKFALAYVVGRRWLGPAFGMSLAVASAVPGVASYQLLGIGHPWFVESMLWLAAWFALRLHAAPRQLHWAAGLGMAAALALHAHPTAVVLLPWALVALFALPSRAVLRALAASGLAVLLVFLPWLLATMFPLLVANTAAENATGPNGIGGAIIGVAGIAQSLLWTQAQNIFDTLLTHSVWGTGLASVAWSSMLCLTLFGLFKAGREPRLRRSLTGSLLTLIWTVAALALLRNHTPFYMAFVALLPLSALLAVAWVALLGDGAPLLRVTWIAILAAVVGLHATIASGLVHIARSGQVESYLPLHSNMQDVSTAVHSESVVAVPTRDALARWLCAQPASVSLHGDMAAAFDMGLRHETDLSCRGQTRRDEVGGSRNGYVGLPQSVWKRAGIHTTGLVGAYALVPVHVVVSPAQALPESTGKRYPPRFESMLAALKQGEWSVAAVLPAGDVVIVSSLLPTLPVFAASAEANGVQQNAITAFANTAVFRCAACATGDVGWRIKVRGGLQQTVSITAVSPAVSSATLTR